MKDEPVYIVTSFHRSGSSMMMRCLEAGGITPKRYKLGDVPWNRTFGTSKYVPNPNGFYFMEDTVFDWPSFYEDFKGHSVKVPRLTLHMLPPGNYKLIYMVRNPKEILQSMRKFIPYRGWGKPTVAVYFYDMLRAQIIKNLLARGDFEILEVNYNELLKDPIAAFEKIKDFGIPIDPELAAEKVDLSLYRNRIPA